jgi:hypothetical protein
MGKGSAMREILAALKSRPPDVLVFLDADGQHNPDDVPPLIHGVLSGMDLVVGSRREERHKTPLYRRLGQAILSHGTGVASRGRKVLDSESGFRALSARAVSQLELTENGFAVETEMIIKATDKGLKIGEVPISTIYVQDGSTLNPFRHGLGVLGSIISMVSERRPLLFFGVGGAISCLLGVLAGARVLAAFARTQAFATGTAILTALFLITGVFSIFTGLVLNILTRNRGR